MILFSATGDASAQAAEAARCALEIRAILPPEAPLALIADQSTAGLDSLIDRAITTVTTESLASLFSAAVPFSSQADGIRLDEATADLLKPTFRVTRVAGGVYLQGEEVARPTQN